MTSDTEIPADDLKALSDEFRAIVRRESGVDFPDDPQEQLRMAIEAVFRSWNNPRAIRYRRQNNIPDDLGTAVNVQSMVYGNLGDDCATGVCFTRNPNTGERGLFGEYLPNAQGEDVVAGVRTPKPVAEMGDDPLLSEAYTQLLGIAERLERHYRDMQDLEFTIQHRELFMLQTRSGKRTGGGGGEDRRRDGERGADRPARSGQPRRTGATRPDCCIRRLTQRRACRCSRPVCPPRPARRPARSSSIPTRRSGAGRRASR